MRGHYSITYTQSLHAINGLLAVGCVGNVLYRRHLYKDFKIQGNFYLKLNMNGRRKVTVLELGNIFYIQGVAKLHTQASTDGRGDQNKDFFVM